MLSEKKYISLSLGVNEGVLSPSPLVHRSMNFHRENKEIPGKNCKVLARNQSILVLPFSEADPHVSEVPRPIAGRGLGSLQRVSAAAQADAHP